jgi:delta8-fatty-acid desaturase
LRQQLLAEGLFETSTLYYVQHYTWLASLFLGAVYCTLACGSFAAHMGGAALLALFWQQMAFVGHDMGHNAVVKR